MEQVTSAALCAECASSLAPGALVCSECRHLVHAVQLEDLARKAQIARNGGDLASSRAFWSQAISFLPPETVQYKSIQGHLTELDEAIAQTAPAPGNRWKRGAAAASPILVILWKLKVLLLGLMKLGTLLSMFLSFGLYWSLYGWAFALGLVVSIYIHEMGHVVALKQFGIPAGAPMFIPGLGAIIQLRGVSLPPLQDARIGLAGPIYGLGAALVALAIFATTHNKIWAVIANLGAVINLFNLIPIWQLDGSRGFHSLTRVQRTALMVLSAALWLATSVGMLLLISAGMAYRLFKQDAGKTPDHAGFIHFALLLAALTAIIKLAPTH